MSVNQELAPIVKSVIVPTSPERAFELFTAEMSAWWPLATHSIGETAARGVHFEGAVGGRIIEYGESGPLGVWGTVSDWDPPSMVSFSWHPGLDPEEAGQVTVRFSAIDGGTQVELTHTGWERRPDGARARQEYETGWPYVLGLLASHGS